MTLGGPRFPGVLGAMLIEIPVFLARCRKWYLGRKVILRLFRQ